MLRHASSPDECAILNATTGPGDQRAAATVCDTGAIKRDIRAMNRLSACVITLNEEHNLPRLLGSLGGIADEIVIVDSGSTDRTGEIAREHEARLEFRRWTHYGEQKNHAAAIATSDWVLSLDADEVLSSRLQSALLDWKKRT